jgi:TolB-like protein/Tfp pilus assembly protein PilF
MKHRLVALFDSYPSTPYLAVSNPYPMPNKLSQFWQELKRRKVIHVIVVYATVSFVLIELVDIIQEPLLLPTWLLTLVIVLLVVGFPIAVVFSWIYDISSKGITKTESVKQPMKKKKGDDPPHDKESWFGNSIAVLPFEDMSPQKDQEYFCDGITEEIINVLTHVESLKVIARTSSFAFKGKHKDMREIGKKLDVESLLEGSIRKDGNRLRITAQLIKVADGSHLWSEKFDRELKDVFDIQDEISMAIVDHLKVKLLGEVKALMVEHPTENLEAYNLYLKGNYYCHLATAKGFEKAIEYFNRALQKDTTYAQPYIGIAEVIWLSTFFGNVPPNDGYPKLEKYVNKALEISNTLAEAHYVTGLINTYYYWNWKKAELSFKQALLINPNSAYSHIYYSFLLTCTGRHEEAIREAKRAQELDPLSSYINSYVGSAYYYGRHFDRAIEECQMVISIDTNYYIARYVKASAHAEKAMVNESLGEHEKATEEIMKSHEELEKAVDLSDGVPFTVALLSCSHYFIGKKDQAEKLIDSLKKRSRTEYIQPICFYSFNRFQGEQDLAFEWLEQACKEHDSYILWMKFVPNDILRIPDEPRYNTLMKKYGLEN